MRYLLDTCVISELMSRRPNERVIQWLDSLDPGSVYLSVITIGEIHKGVAKLPDSAGKLMLQDWLNHELLIRFSGRILSIDTNVMLTWGQLTATLEGSGKKMPAIDSLIAAIALHGNFSLATRNEEDFKNAGVIIVNPWK